ncbi:hypothetical protein O181_121290 [Austropuccinia psidii MF-1]|uniref:Uncharacterized protein n=1 Tax=Austropuccinia psidii MF-1 TaxID=1389203 RepID=A0A9Q3KLZ7_9BASI|nr:hypothetical protein [Austropuccinia psidii MF-1]
MELKETLKTNNGMKYSTWMNTSGNNCFGGPGNDKTGSTSRILQLKMEKSARSQEILSLITPPGTSTGKKHLYQQSSALKVVQLDLIQKIGNPSVKNTFSKLLKEKNSGEGLLSNKN